MKKAIFTLVTFLIIVACKNNSKTTTNTDASGKTEDATKYPSDVIPFMEKWKILLGDGTYKDDLVNYKKDDFFYVENDGETNWVVYKTPNSGITSRTSSNTRTELGEKAHWIPETGGKLTGTLKVQHVSTTGNANIPSSYAVVIGQIHSDEGHENEPLKIYYKKFPGHTKGSVFWNYEINTVGEDNSGRWDYSTAVWGYDFSVVGKDASTAPEEPKDGIELGEEFSYEVNVYKGVMYLTFSSKGHKTITFTKNLLKSDFSTKEDIPQQIIDVYASRRTVNVEREIAYAGEINYFKQGAYNQANSKTGSKTFDGNIEKQYANGAYTEVWFKKATVGKGTAPNH
ncbi:polysaccharide lyase family 7 protein [Oceanihabitans sp. 2_MG-2023]|uniref:polysaccharide lyase family 7 protein n=1 Tax=Oceanihabitans sp. 2_MG-2023 TaxID=3062661 RepID=UPI0026E3949C|nr:polysaccharide lyase family 7 protein [Oceanihabitans sp. 2_MG-2023]MDO6596557.1 polysaccharide lyase family 7 protein [Oceanihabitans sp. 2_MG-2023]